MSRRRFRKSGRSKSFNSRVRAIASSVVKKNSETKHKTFEYNVQSISDSATGNVVDQALNAIAGGSGKSQRTGNAVFLSGLNGKFVIAGADTTNIVRVVLYIAKDVDDTLTADGVEVYNAIDLDRFTVLSDFFVTTSSNGSDAKSFTIRRKFNRGKKRGISAHWASSSASDYAKNALRLYIVSDSGVVTHPALTGFIKLFYKDL